MKFFTRNIIPAQFAIVIMCVAKLALADSKQKLAVTMDGSSTVFPISEAIAEEFQKKHPKIRITVGSSGTGGGIKKFLAGEIDIAGASRHMSSSETETAKKSKIDFVELGVAYDGIVIVVNHSNPMTNITMTDLKKLWEPNSKIKSWKDIPKSTLTSNIKLYGPGPDSGTFDFFTEVVVGKARSSRQDYAASEDDNILVKGVSSDLNSLGYFGYGYFVENQKHLKALALDAGKGPILPTHETITAKTYPLSRPLLIYVKKDSAKRSEVRDLVNFYLEHAAQMSESVGFVKLDKDSAQKTNDAWKKSLKDWGL